MTMAELEQPDTENRAPRTDDQVGQEFQEFARCEALNTLLFRIIFPFLGGALQPDVLGRLLAGSKYLYLVRN